MKRAIKTAVRDSIRSQSWGYDYAICELMEDGKPPSRCGQLFVAVHDGGRSSDQQNSLDERYAVIVTVTMRSSYIAKDRIGLNLIDEKQIGTKLGFDDVVDRIRALQHMNYNVMNAANTIILASVSPGTDVYGFAEPLMYQGEDGPPRSVGADWFNAEPESLETGIVQGLKFGNARRLQRTAIQT
jgi:hypothetical protein